MNSKGNNMGLLTKIANRFRERRSLENPSTPLSSPDSWLYEALSAGPSSSGINVSRVTALTYAPFWHGCDLITGALVRCALIVWKRRAGGGREHDIRHPAYYLLLRKANEMMTASVFKKTLQGHVLINGNGYAYIDRDTSPMGGGRPTALLPLHPDRTYAVRENGRLWYVHHMDAETFKLAAEDVLHVKGLSFDGLQGYNVIEKARETLGLGMAAQRFGSIFFRNGSNPHIALEYPGKLSQQAQDNLRNSWERAHAGLDNAHKVALLMEGVKLQQYGIKAKDAQLLELLGHNRVDMALLLGLPPHKMGDSSRTAYNSLEQENQACLDECYGPWLKTWEEECWDKLLAEDEKETGSHDIEFNRRHLVSLDSTARTARYQSGLASGWLTVDDVLSEEGMNPLGGEDGRRRFRPANVVPLGQETEPVGPGKQPQPKEEE